MEKGNTENKKEIREERERRKEKNEGRDRGMKTERK